MKNIFLVNQFDDAYAQEEYCVHVLDIPDEKIYDTEIIGKGLLEIVLNDVNNVVLEEEWYVNLTRLSL